MRGRTPVDAGETVPMEERVQHLRVALREVEKKGLADPSLNLAPSTVRALLEAWDKQQLAERMKEAENGESGQAEEAG